MIEGSEREVFQQSLRQATKRHFGAALDAALTDIGWPDALAVDPHIAVATLFPLQGQANATSSALDWVMAGAFGLDGGDPPAVVLPPAGSAEGVIAAAWETPSPVLCAAGRAFAGPGARS